MIFSCEDEDIGRFSNLHQRTLDRTWNNANSTEQIPLQEYFAGAFKEIETSGDYKFLSTFVTTHKKEAVFIVGSQNFRYTALPFFSR